MPNSTEVQEQDKLIGAHVSNEFHQELRVIIAERRVSSIAEAIRLSLRQWMDNPVDQGDNGNA